MTRLFLVVLEETKKIHQSRTASFFWISEQRGAAGGSLNTEAAADWSVAVNSLLIGQNAAVPRLWLARQQHDRISNWIAVVAEACWTFECQ